MRQLLFILLFLLAAPMQAQEVKVFAHIVDAQTNEAMPFAKIYVSPTKGTVSNEDGDFMLAVMPDDTLHISFIGYQKQSIRAAELPRTVRMNRGSKTLGQVTVLDKNGILDRVAKRLQEAYSKHKGEESRYFMRQTNVLSGSTQMVEAYIEARSAVNMRKISFLSGRHFRSNEGESNELNEVEMLEFSNTQQLLCLAPQTKGEYIWTNTIKPFNKRPIGGGMGYEKCYKTAIASVIGEDGREVFKLDFEPLDNEVAKEAILCGSLYVDAKTLDPLKFEGHLDNILLRSSYNKIRRVDLAGADLIINYDNTKGYPQIVQMATTLRDERVECKTLIYCTDEMQTPLPKNSERMENMIKAIFRAGYDERLWDDPIVMRTAEEERLLTGENPAFALTHRWEPLHIENPDALADWTIRADSAALQHPQEKVFLHLDNTCYFLGEAIRFKAYSRRTDTGRPSTISNVLYVDLLNHDGYLMERKIVRMKDGEGHGSFVLRDDSTMYSGFYELRAYTRWQLNWGQFEHEHPDVTNYWFHNEKMAKDYFRDYEKLYSRVVPVYDKPLAPGDYTRDMTLRRMMRYYPANDEKPKLKLAFYPEGGNLVQGIENRVAFEAMTEEGENVSGTLTVNGQTIATVHRGRGVFTLKPSDKRIEAEFRSEDGRTVKEKLPKAEADGVALTLETSKDSTQIRIRTNGEKVPQTLALTVRHEGKPTHYHTMASNQENRIVLQHTELTTGVNQVTVYDAEGRVWADRLFFHRTAGLETPTLQIEGVKDEYTPCEHITFKIKGKSAGAKFSLSVRDAYSSDEIYDNGSILTEMLLSSELRGFIPNPGWYFEQDDDQHRTALDLLMMTQGWRRFNWKEMASGSFNPTEPAETHMRLEGEVREYPSVEKEESLSLEEFFRMELRNQGNIIYHQDHWKNKVMQIEAAAEATRDHFGFRDGNDRAYSGEGYKEAPHTTRVHLELIKGNQGLALRSKVKEGAFSTSLPNFNESCIMHLAASDTAKWKKGENDKNRIWVLPDENQYPEFYVRLSKPHPRFPKPYSFYHTHLPQANTPRNYDGLAEPDVHQMQQVSVRSKRGRLIKRMYVGPAVKFDAYEAFNAVVDAGLLDGYYPGANNFKDAVAHYYIGDMGVDSKYDVNLIPRFSSLSGGSKNLTRQLVMANRRSDRKILAQQYLTERLSGISSQRYEIEKSLGVISTSALQSNVDATVTNSLSGINPSEQSDRDLVGSDKDANLYNQLKNLDSVFIYTDYSPRFEGHKKFEAPNIPEVTVYLKRYADGSRRETFRDRFIILPGYCIPEDFYHVDYSKFKLPEGTKDHRRTLYWNPAVELDYKGEATITLYNNSNTTHIAVEMNGQTEDGTLLWGRE